MVDQPDSTVPDTSASIDETRKDETQTDERQKKDALPTDALKDEGKKDWRQKDERPKTDRPFRVKLRGSVLVLVRLPNRRSVRAAFHQLSTTGGVIHLEKPLEEKLDVELIFHVGQSTIRNRAQMLFPMWATQGWMQPFRFVDLSDANRKNLDANLKSFLGEGVASAAAGA
jgi:hypothetical protein